MDVALAETVVLIGELPGSLVYHLVLLFALQTAAAVALAGWRRERAPAAGRLALAASLSGLLVLASLVLTVLTAVPVFGGQTLYGPLILPPLARAVGTLNLLLWLWAAAFPAPSRAADVVAILLGVLILAGAGVSWVLWAQALAQGAGAYNGSLEDTVWGLAQAGLTVLGLIALILRASLRRPADLPVGGILALVLLAGQTLHLLFLWPGTSLPGTVRLAELVAAPLFMALVYRRALAGPALPPAAARPAAAAAEPARRGLDSKAAVALASLNTSADPDELAQIVTLAVAHACRAELCLLLSAPDDLGMCSLTCAYDLSRQQFIAGTFFSAAEMPALRAALRQDGVTSLAPAQHGPELRRLSGAAGLGSIGPTLIAPLGDEQQRLGALALMALYSHREWSAEEQNLLSALREPIRDALGGDNQINRLLRDLSKHQTRADAAEEARRAARAEADQLSVALEAARDEAERLAQSITHLKQDMTVGQPAPAEEPDEVAALRASLFTGAGAAVDLAEVEAEWRERVEAAEQAAEAQSQQAGRLQADLELAQDQLQEARHRTAELSTELETLRSNLPAVAAQAAELERLRAGQAALAQAADPGLAAEVQRLQSELTAQTQRAAALEADLARQLAAPLTETERGRLEAQIRELREMTEAQHWQQATFKVDYDFALQQEEQLRKELELTRAELRRLTEAGAARPADNAEAAAQTQVDLAQAQAALEQARTELAQLKASVAEARAAADTSQIQLAEARAELTAKERQIAKSLAVVATLNDQARRLTELQSELDEHRAQAAAAQAQLQASQTELETLRAAARQPAFPPAEREALTARAAEAESALHLARIQLAEAQDNLRAREDELAQTQHTAAALDAQARQAGQAQAEFNQLRAQLAEAEDRQRAREAELAAAQERLTEQAGQLAEAQAAAAGLEAQTRAAAQAQAAAAAYQAQLGEAQAQLAAHAGAPDTAGALAQAQTEAQDLRAQLEAAQHTLRQQTAALTAAQDRLRLQTEELTTARRAAAALEDQTRELAEAQAELQALRFQTAGAAAAAVVSGARPAEVEALRARLAEAEAAVQRREAELAQAQAAAGQTDQAQQELNALHAQLQARDEALARAQAAAAEAETLRARLAEAEAAVQRHEAELAQAQAAAGQNGQAQQELNALRNQLQARDEALARAQAAAAEAEDAVQASLAARQELEAAQAQVAEVQDKYRAKEKELADAMAALAELANQTHTLTVTQKQLADKERQLAEMQTNLATAAEAGPDGEGARPFLPAASMEVIASLTQELRQPMSAVVGYADLLLGESVGILGALQRKFLERIKASSERMESLLGDLIRVTDIDAGGLQLVPESIDVMVIVEDAILSCGAQFRDKGINLRLDIAEQLPTVSADRDALRQIISHLLANAGAASGNDGDVILKVRAELDPAAVDPASHALLIAVRDSGGGVAPEDQPRVFQRFYRADAPLIAGLGETGVGLAVAKALVEAHGGRIWLTSDPGQGSTFTVLLPIHGKNGSAAPRLG